MIDTVLEPRPIATAGSGAPTSVCYYRYDRFALASRKPVGETSSGVRSTTGRHGSSRREGSGRGGASATGWPNGAGILGVGLALSILLSWLIGLPVVLDLDVLCPSPFMTVTNSDVMPGDTAPTGERLDDRTIAVLEHARDRPPNDRRPYIDPRDQRFTPRCGPGAGSSVGRSSTPFDGRCADSTV